MPFPSKRWLTAKEAADRIGATPGQVARLAETNAVEWVLLVSADSLDAYQQQEQQ